MLRPTATSSDKDLRAWFEYFHGVKLPISVKCYRDLLSRVANLTDYVTEDLDYFAQAVEYAILHNGDADYGLDDAMKLALRVVEPFIERALARAERARRCAAERKARKAAMKAEEEALKETEMKETDVTDATEETNVSVVPEETDVLASSKQEEANTSLRHGGPSTATATSTARSFAPNAVKGSGSAVGTTTREACAWRGDDSIPPASLVYIPPGRAGTARQSGR